MLPEHFSRSYTSKARPECTAICGKYRFSVLADRLIRIEYDPEALFENSATQSVVNRLFDYSEFKIEGVENKIVIKTDYLTLSVDTALPPEKSGLEVKTAFDGKETVWHFGDEPDTLKGTYRTLDGIFVERSVTLGEGVCSRAGYAVLDDSKSLTVLDDGWVAERREGITDIYFFGYGHDYFSATSAFYKLTGVPPLLPSYVFGNWWSRFENYSEKSYERLITDFEENDIPLSVSVIDMDWHWSRGEGGKPAKDEWTGYSWNTRLFPDYKRFLKWLHSHNLHTALNVHPAQGVQDHEDMYADMAEAMGIDPKTGETVKFDPANKEFWKPYFNILHHPYEENGVDFWWMDWQQGTDSGIKGLDPLWILNHTHTLDCERSEKRPMYFSRYSGPGSQRFYVGFSGDAYITWDAFAFEPYFTATAANIGFPYWSHDIGGFQHGARDKELYVRWIQFGVFSPICRLHSTNYDFVSKEPWRFPADAQKAAEQMLRLRHKLFPYIYTLNYRAHTQGKALCTPLYYYYPEAEQAYSYKNQYFFGSELLACPVTEHSDSITALARTDIWLPEGKWIDFFTGNVYEGGKELSVYRDIYSFPLFARAGAIVPMNPHIKGDNKLEPKENMELYVFAGATNSFFLYEDDGESNNYKNGDFAVTEYALDYTEQKAVFTIKRPKGRLSVIPEKRNYKIYLRGFSRGALIEVASDGRKSKFTLAYDEKTNTAVLELFGISTADETVITVASSEGLLSKNENYKQRIFDIMVNSEVSNSWSKYQAYARLTDDRADISGRLAAAEKSCPEESGNMLEAVKEIINLL